MACGEDPVCHVAAGVRTDCTGCTDCMGQCLARFEPNEVDDELEHILRASPFLRKLPFIQAASELDDVGDNLALLPGEFCWSLNFSPAFVAELCYQGFVPMAELVPGGRCVLLPKLHSQRCVLAFEQLHIPSKIRKRAARFQLTVNTCFEDVLHGCQVQHGDGCWLHQPLVDIFRALHHALPSEQSHGNTSVATQQHCLRHYQHAFTSDGCSTPVPSRTPRGVRFHSFELWHRGTLVAGELGYSMGACYTSLSGFHARASAGTVQCIAAAHVLKLNGFQFWDLGMELPYKLLLGAVSIPRHEFLSRLANARAMPPTTPCVGQTSARSSS